MDWDKIVSNTMKALTGYAREISLLGPKACGAEPEEWSASHELPATKERPVEKEAYATKRRIVDRNGKIVSEWMSIENADMVACLSPVDVMTMLRAIDSMASIISEYRNRGNLIDYETPQKVRSGILEIQNRRVVRDFYRNVDSALRRYKKSQPNDEKSQRAELLKKVFLESTDPIWLLTPEERLERGLTSQKNRAAYANGSRSRPKGRHFRSLHANRKYYRPKKNPGY